MTQPHPWTACSMPLSHTRISFPPLRKVPHVWVLLSPSSTSWGHEVFRHLYNSGLFKGDYKVVWNCFFLKKFEAQDTCLHSKISPSNHSHRSCHQPVYPRNYHIRRILGCFSECLPISFRLPCWIYLVEIFLFKLINFIYLFSESSSCPVYYCNERLQSLKSLPSKNNGKIKAFFEQPTGMSVINHIFW